MIKLSDKIKTELFKLILKQDNAFGGNNHPEDVLDFCNSIWDLRNMSSGDNRYSNAYDDIFQHIVNNSDYDYEYLFLSRLKLLEGDKQYEKFILRIHSAPLNKMNHLRNQIDLVLYQLRNCRYVLFLLYLIQSVVYSRYKRIHETPIIVHKHKHE